VRKLVFVLFLIATTAPAAAEDGLNPRGLQIFQKLCVECHAKDGGGVEGKADDPLVGSRSIKELAGRIERTMPEDEEKLCVGEDAQAVAEYIFHAFYSVEARVRNEGARIQLSRLTAPQYRTTVADLIGSFVGGYGREPKPDRGLKGRYDGSIKEKAGKPPKPGAKFERVDPVIRFDYGEGIPKTPEAESFNPVSFTINWSGVIIPEETGIYEFVVRTRNGAQLWVNELNPNPSQTKAMIDGWVAPNNELREMSAKIFLLGGRAYPLNLNFFKYKEKAAAIELLWKPPHGVLHHLPERVTRADGLPDSFIANTPFPPDDRSVGYERGTAVSKAWFEAATQAALEAADYVILHIDKIARTRGDDPDRAKKIGEFGVEFTARAFRRPLSEQERIRIVDRRFDEAKTLEAALKRLVLHVLTSPEFLYPNLPQENQQNHDQWAVASKLALVLWDSVPDTRIRNLAGEGKLKNIRAEAERMLQDPRAKAKMHGFFEHWLELSRAEELAKDKAIFPEFNQEMFADLRTSLWLFLDDVVWSEGSSYQQLLTADYLFLNSRLAKLYGPDKATIEGSGFQRVSFDPNRRSGIVTHPFLLTSFAYHNNTSPIHRGVFLTRNIVGLTLGSPPEANLFEESNFDPKATMREKVTELTRSKACMACHTTINPLGFSLEHYDGIGRWRAKDQGKPIDPSGELKTDDGETLKLSGARDVATFAANRPSAHEAFVEHLFHHMVKQPAVAYGARTLERLREEFEKSGFNIQHLMVEIAVTAAESGG
jgi:hypothetical protein